MHIFCIQTTPLHLILSHCCVYVCVCMYAIVAILPICRCCCCCWVWLMENVMQSKKKFSIHRYLGMLSETRICWKPIENLQVEYVICMEITSCTRNIIKYKIKKRFTNIQRKREKPTNEEKNRKERKKNYTKLRNEVPVRCGTWFHLNLTIFVKRLNPWNWTERAPWANWHH